MNDDRRRLVHVFATFGAGGPQVRAVQLMQHLGPSCRHVVMAMDGNTEAQAMLPEHVAAEFVPPPPGRGFLLVRRQQAAWLRSQRPDLVLTYNWGTIETVAAARSSGLPLVHHEDGFGPEEASRRLRRRSWLRRLLLRKVPVIVPSQVLQKIALGEWRLPQANVHHLVNGVDLTRFAPALPRTSAQPLTIGTVGGLRAVKDHSNLLRAVAAMPQRVRVCLVGRGPLEGALREQAQQLGIADRIEFAGQTDDTAPFYRRFDLFVLSSRTEQMPIAMLEAMASGLSVVATDVGDVRRILPREAAAGIVEPADPAALAAALGRLIDDAALRSRLGAANRRHVEQHFDGAVCLERFAALYRTSMRAR